MAKHIPHEWMDMRREWPVLTAYQRFETLVGFVLTFVVAAVILVAIYRLIVSVTGTVLKTLNPLDHAVFQVVFGDIMTVLIALARKVIVIDLYATAPATVGALGVLALSLGVTYWLIRDGSGEEENTQPGPG